MSDIAIAFLIIAILGLLLEYRSVTQSRAAAMRDDMVDEMAAALQNPRLSARGRKAALGIFHASLKPGAIPRYVARMMWCRWRNRPDDPKHDDLSDADYGILSRLIRHHMLRINFVAGPHWYVLMALLIVSAAAVAAIAGHAFRWTAAQRTHIEHALIDTFVGHAH